MCPGRKAVRRPAARALRPQTSSHLGTRAPGQPAGAPSARASDHAHAQFECGALLERTDITTSRQVPLEAFFLTLPSYFHAHSACKLRATLMVCAPHSHVLAGASRGIGAEHQVHQSLTRHRPYGEIRMQLSAPQVVIGPVLAWQAPHAGHGSAPPLYRSFT